MKYFVAILLLAALRDCNNTPCPNPCPTPTPPVTTTTTTTMPNIQGINCIPGQINCDCVDQPPGQGKSCVVCDSSAPGGVRNIGFVPVCPPYDPPPPTTTTTTTLAPAPPSTCNKMQGIQNCPEGGNSFYRNAINDSLSRTSGCAINTDCFIPDWQKVIVNMLDDLNARGYCTSYDLNSGGVGSLGSEFGIRANDVYSEYYQPITSAQKARWSNTLSTCTPAYDEENVAEVKAAFGVTPPPSTCPVNVGGDYYVDLRVTTIGGNPQLYTATSFYCGFPLRNDIFSNCGTKCCTLGVDGGSQVAVDCEHELSGPPVWSATDSLEIIPAFDGNPYNVKVNGGHGKLKACGISSCSNEIAF